MWLKKSRMFQSTKPMEQWKEECKSSARFTEIMSMRESRDILVSFYFFYIVTLLSKNEFCRKEKTKTKNAQKYQQMVSNYNITIMRISYYYYADIKN